MSSPARRWFTWVPEWSIRGPEDPWAHRKGEPRVFALLWCAYLMAAALVTLFAVRSVGAPSAEQYRYGARALLVLCALGVTVLWPALRLSQAAPTRPARAALIDVLIVAMPLNAVLWPMPVLTRWPFGVTAGTLVMLSSWAFAAGGWVAWGSARGGLGRAGSMAACVLLASAAPLAGAWAAEAPAWWGMLSPFTAGAAMTAAPSGLSPVMSATEWMLAITPAALGAPAWAAACLARRRPAGADGGGEFRDGEQRG